MITVLIWIDIICLILWLFLTICVYNRTYENKYERQTFPIYTRIFQFIVCFIPVVNIIDLIILFLYYFDQEVWIIKPNWLNKIIKGIIKVFDNIYWFLNKEI